MLTRALVLLVTTIAGCWPMWGLPDWDGTEGRRVQIALEMARANDWMVPMLGGEPTWAKPPLHYWLLGAARACFGDGQLALRLPSVLGAFAAALLAGELLRAWFGARAGWIGALGIACSPLVLFTWPTAEIDPLFATLTAGSLWCLATGVARERRALVIASGLLGGLALLQKGVPYFLFASGAYLVWWRHRRCRGFVAHVAPMLLVVAAYVVPLFLWSVAPGEVLAVASEESVGRVAYFEWKHVRDVPAFWVRAVAAQLPFVLWCLWEWRGPRDARMDAGDLTLRMCSGAAVLAIVMLTFFPGRPTRYILPNVLLFTFAVSPAVAHFSVHPGPVPKFARRSLTVVGVAGALALLVLPFVAGAGVGAIGLAAAAAAGPLLVRTPMHVVAYCLVLPLVAACTAGLDRAAGWPDGPRARVDAGRLLARELDAIGAGPGSDLRTAGHVDSPLLLAAGILPPGDESGRRPWGSRFVLHEVPHEGPAWVAVPPDYVERLRLELPIKKSFVLRERR